MSGHYASADVGRLVKLANLVLNRQETRTVLRVANGWPVVQPLWITGPAAVPQRQKGLGSFDPSPCHMVRLAGIEPTTPWFVGS